MSRKAGSEEFTQALTRAQRNKQARERLLTDDTARAARLEGVEGIEGLDEKLVSQAFQGDVFGDDDRRRYDALVNGEDPASDSDPGNSTGTGNSTTIPSPVTDSPVIGRPLPNPVISGPNDGGQNVYQDNDITTSIDGNNNTVSNFQDNSVSQGIGSSDYTSRYARGLKDQYVLNLMDR